MRDAYTTHLHAIFDGLEPERLRARANMKWQKVDDDVLPLWVADMDLPIAKPIRKEMSEYIAGDNFGYPPQDGLPGLRRACADRLVRRYGWDVAEDDILMLSGIIPGMFACVETFTSPGDEVILSTPLYPWFATSVERSGRVPIAIDLTRAESGRWQLDPAAMAERIGPMTKMVMVCNPHNPTGRVFSRAELQGVADVALEHDLVIVSDELHADLTYAGAAHTPMASLGAEVAARTITLYGPTKAFNIAGMKVGFAIAQNEELRERLAAACHGPVPEPNVVAQVAARAALGQCDDWLDATLSYLEGNRALFADFVRDSLPGVRHMQPEATYLAWLDFSDTAIADAPAAYLLEQARVALNEGTDYGAAGAGHARLNFATSRSIVSAALDRIARALAAA